ncbi:YciI family protein [Kitasatospora sp. NPDC052896]|uniref:YciI family protein n=1 Tax=Kitasatospora sp. NPDC052896 TaxID=3364061 RepID=UPI0037C8C6FD
MPQYLLSVVDDEFTRKRSAEEARPIFEAVDAFNTKLRQDGSWVFAGGLSEPAMATTVDARGPEVVLADGPFVETKEYLGGFWIIQAPDLDVALELAAQASRACDGKVEVRPFETGPQGAE